MAKHSRSQRNVGRIGTEELRQLARAGAEARLQALDSERAALLRMFPDLRSGARAADAPQKIGRPRGRRSPMTPAERKAVSLRMKKYWAERRAAHGKSSTTR